MRFSNVCIEEVGYVLPPNVIASSQLEAYFADTLKRLRLPPGQVEKLSGIHERRWWDEGVQPSTVAAMAGKRALDRAGHVEPVQHRRNERCRNQKCGNKGKCAQREEQRTRRRRQNTLTGFRPFKALERVKEGINAARA